MQKITRNQLIDKASELLSNGTVSCVLGWGHGEFGYDVTPTIFKTPEEMQTNFVFNDFCGANFSKYLVNLALGELALGVLTTWPTKTSNETLK